MNPTKTHIGTFPGKNKPSEILSKARADNWQDFTALLVVITALFAGWVFVGGGQI